MDPLRRLLGQSDGMRAVREQAARLLTRYATRGTRLPPVLVQGETGTGKGLLAAALHHAGPRGAGPFVDVNCAAIPETLLEAELFGFERGAFTGARQSKPGLFQAAHGGTIFLDEIALLPEALQAKLLKVIEERTVRRLGSTRSEAVDAWVVAAASDDLRAAVQARRFREDLYHRLAVVTLRLPPLRDRGEDIERLAEHFLARACEDYGLARKSLGSAARAALRAYPWPGNVRELANVMERVALLAEADLVDPESLALPEAPPVAGRELAPPGREAATQAAAEAERSRIVEALGETAWNLSRAAARLGLPRNTLRYRMEKLGLAARSAAAPAATEEGPRPAAGARVRWEPRRVTMLAARLPDEAGLLSRSEESRLLEVCLDKLRAFGGRMVELSARAVVGAFGIEPVEDAPRRAAHAAMAIVTEAGREGGVSRGRHRVTAALHTETLQVGRVGERPELDADGKRAALAVLEGLLAGAEPGAAVVSAASAPFLRRRFELRASVGRGASGGRAYRLVASIEGERGATSLVGRERELRLLLDALERAVEGQGQLVSIVGEPGIGKSRLVRELRRRLGEGVTWLEGRALSFGGTMPFHPLVDLLRRAADIEEGDGGSSAGDKLQRYLASLGPDLRSCMPYLKYLLGLDPGDAALLGSDPNARRAGIVEALRQLILRAADREPVVLVVEDAHWMDRASEECLALLAGSLGARRVLLLLTCRPDQAVAFADRTVHTRLALGTLSAAESLRMARELLAADRLPEPLADLVVRKAEGNPFFVEELVHALEEVGAVRREAEGLALARPLDTVVVPNTIQDVILARLARLDEAPRRLLQVASVIGKDVPFPLLSAVAELGEATMRQALTQLAASEFLYETSVFPEVAHTFKHALTHEVAYGSLEPATRRALHARIVDAIARLQPEREAEQVERLAHHATRGELWARAVGYHRRAGEKAFARSANREAVASLEQALAALARLPESPETLAEAIDVRLALRSALLPLGEIRRILAYLREAEALARNAGDSRRLAWVFTYMTTYFLFAGEPQRSAAVGAEATRIAEETGDLALGVAAGASRGHAYREQGRYAEAVALLGRTIGALEGDLVRERFGQASPPAVYARSILAVCHAARGQFAEGRAAAAEAVRIAEDAQLPFSVVLSSIALGETAVVQADVDQAVPALQRALEVIRGRDIPMWFPWAAATLGQAMVLAGRPAEGGRLLDQALERATALPFLFGHSRWLAWRAEALALEGRADEARRMADEALRVAREREERGYEAEALATVGRLSEAEGVLREALDLATTLGMRPLAAHCRLDLAHRLRRTGQRAEAAEHLAAAAAAYRALEMPFWLARAEAAAREVA